ncbi:MAG: hypothetical protein ACE366_10250 [Bradymonadia bacterium]
MNGAQPAPAQPGELRALTQKHVDLLGLGLTLALAATALLPRMRQSPMLMGSIIGAAAVVGALWLAVRTRRPAGPQLTVQKHIRQPHWVQTLMHSSIFIYWGMYVDLVGHEAWLFIPQILFAYGLDMFFGWKNHGNWRLGFGPLPIIGSTNLFLWFKDDWFYLQFLMVALVFLSREYIKWNLADRKTHIFNPSAFGLTVLSVILIATQNSDISYGLEIATTLGQPPGGSMFWWIFVTGLIVQTLFGTPLVTMGAALAAFATDAVHHSVTGDWFFVDSSIPIAVFLGMNLLITDPVTSPRGKMGKLLFGAGYGLLVFPLLAGLEAIDTPSYFDKLLAVPVLNLMAPLLDRVGAGITALVPAALRLDRFSDRSTNYAFVGIWALSFVILHPRLTDHPGAKPGYWMELCTEANKDFACRNLRLLTEQACDINEVEGCIFAAQMYDEGIGVEPSIEQKTIYLARACRLGDAGSCAVLAVGYRDGVGLTADVDKASVLFAKGCDGGVQQACNELGIILQSGTPTTAPNLTAALPRFTQACTGGIAEACMNLAVAHLTGRGTAVDPNKGLDLFVKACDLKAATGCLNASAMLVAENQGITPDPARALVLNKKGCALDNGVACTRVGTQYARGMGVATDNDEAIRWYTRGCEAGDQGGCAVIGPN